jgi:4-nitrophenyl phosphatase
MDIKQIKALILDADGVLWRELNPIGDLESIFSLIKQKGIKYCFATNNSSKSVGEYIERFEEFKIPANEEQVFTSGQVTADLLKDRFPDGGNIFVVGMEGLVHTLNQHGFNNSSKDPIAVVVGFDKKLTYEKLRKATLLIRQGVSFIGTNGDKTFPNPEGLVPGAGSILAALVASTNIEPEIIGKPHPTMFLQALKYLRQKPEEVLVIGDRLETDIAGGQAAGCKTAVVLSGVSTQEMINRWKPSPDLIAEDLTHIAEML